MNSETPAALASGESGRVARMRLTAKLICSSGTPDPLNDLLKTDDFVLFDDLTAFGCLPRRGAHHDFKFFFLRRVVQIEAEHETVLLCFGQRVGAFLFDRVLCRDDAEGQRELEGFHGDRHLAFLHGFEKRRLRFRRRSVDFIREEQLGEDRSLIELKFGNAVAVLFENLASDDVRWHEVGRKLDSLRIKSENFCECADHDRFRESGDADQETVPLAEKRRKDSLHGLRLSHDDFAHLCADFRTPPGDQREILFHMGGGIFRDRIQDNRLCSVGFLLLRRAAQ